MPMLTLRARRFLHNESGATAIEYALLCSLLAVVLVIALTNLGGRASGVFSEVSSALK
jgi:pilus assembly protein Flp/PilA